MLHAHTTYGEANLQVWPLSPYVADCFGGRVRPPMTLPGGGVGSYDPASAGRPFDQLQHHPMGGHSADVGGAALRRRGQHAASTRGRGTRSAHPLAQPLPTCGEVFECATSLKAKYPNRRCEKHHRPGLAVTERGKISRRFYRSANRPRNATG